MAYDPPARLSETSDGSDASEPSDGFDNGLKRVARFLTRPLVEFNENEELR